MCGERRPLEDNTRLSHVELERDRCAVREHVRGGDQQHDKLLGVGEPIVGELAPRLGDVQREATCVDERPVGLERRHELADDVGRFRLGIDRFAHRVMVRDGGPGGAAQTYSRSSRHAIAFSHRLQGVELFATGLIARAAARAGASAATRELSRNTDAANAAYREEMEDLEVELANRLDALEGIVVKFIGSEDNRRIVRHLDIEISREALPDRRRMLAEAALGLARICLPVKRAARVGRTLRNLDVDDVRHLHGLQLARVARPRSDGRCSEDLMWRFNTSEGENLVAEHCIRLCQPGFGGVARPLLTLTERGHDVLGALAEYLAVVSPLTPLDALPPDR